MSLAVAPSSRSAPVTPWGILLAAGSLPVAESPRSSDMQYRPYPPYSKKWLDMAWDSEQQNAGQFQLLRQARLLMESDGGEAGTARLESMKLSSTMPTDESIRQLLKPLNSMRNLANVVSDGAIFSHLNGNDTEGIARARDNFNIADCVRQTPYIVSQLVAAGIDALGCYNLNIMASAFRLTGPNSAAPREQVKQTIAWLLDERPIRESWRKAFENELGNPPETGGKASTRIATWDAAESAHDLPLLMRACDLQSLPESNALVKQCGPRITAISADRLFVTEFRVLAERRMTAIDLAMQLYRADHHSAFPKSLDELVPDYLAAIPRDPFSSNNAAIGYQMLAWPDGIKRPVLFVETGPDFKLDAEPRVGWYSHGKDQVRQYRDLTLPTH
jgi:hypothetical protein